MFVITWALPQADRIGFLLIPVFLVLLPLANAFLDWLSLGFTRGLLYAIGHGHHTSLVTLGFAGFDILLALVFLFLIASLTTLILSLLNAATVAWGGQSLLDLQLLLDGLALEPGVLEFGWIHGGVLSMLLPNIGRLEKFPTMGFSYGVLYPITTSLEHYRIHFMMLSTLIPTLVHFSVAGASAVLLLPESLRRRVLRKWDYRDHARIVAFGWISFAPVLALLGPTLLLWGLYELLTAWGGTIGYQLLAWVHGIALAVDSSTTAPSP